MEETRTFARGRWKRQIMVGNGQSNPTSTKTKDYWEGATMWNSYSFNIDSVANFILRKCLL